MSHPVYSGDQPQYHFVRAQQERNDIVEIEERSGSSWAALLFRVSQDYQLRGYTLEEMRRISSDNSRYRK